MYTCVCIGVYLFCVCSLIALEDEDMEITLPADVCRIFFLFFFFAFFWKCFRLWQQNKNWDQLTFSTTRSKPAATRLGHHCTVKSWKQLMLMTLVYVKIWKISLCFFVNPVLVFESCTCKGNNDRPHLFASAVQSELSTDLLIHVWNLNISETLDKDNFIHHLIQ